MVTRYVEHIEHNVVIGPVKLPFDDHTRPRISNVDYYLEFSSSDDRDFKNYLKEARRFAGKSRGEVRVLDLTLFVYKTIKYDEDFWKKYKEAEEGGKDSANEVVQVSLSQVLRDRKGTCLEKASLLYMILVEEGFDAYLAAVYSDFYENDRGHALVKVRIDGEFGEWYSADPTNNIIEPTHQYDRQRNIRYGKLKFDLIIKKLVRP